MSMFDKAKEAMGNHSDKVGEGIDKASDAAKDRFSGHDEQIDKAADKARDFAGNQGGDQEQGR